MGSIWRIIRTRYGNVRLDFGQPFSLQVGVIYCKLLDHCHGKACHASRVYFDLSKQIENKGNSASRIRDTRLSIVKDCWLLSSHRETILNVLVRMKG